MPFCVGLTGGIGSGKSTAARLFADLGAGVVDVDDIAHELTAPGGAAIPAIRAAFGNDAIARDGRLDRARMRERVFTDSSAKNRLEAILHPMIGVDARARVARAMQPYVMLVVPLLLERDGYREIINRIAVVDCSEETQIGRTMKRSQLSEASVRAIMAAQASRAQRLARADDVLNNNDSEGALCEQVETMHRRYLALAGRGRVNVDPS